MVGVSGWVTGAFAVMAILGKVDQLLSPKGLSMTIAPLGAVSAVLFATPNAPGTRVIFLTALQMFLHSWSCMPGHPSRYNLSPANIVLDLGSVFRPMVSARSDFLA